MNLRTISPGSRAPGDTRQHFGIEAPPLARKGVVVGRIFCLDAVRSQGRPWMWASGHNGDIRRVTHGYEPTREAAMVRGPIAA
jgi:hypothetical protein